MTLRRLTWVLLSLLVVTMCARMFFYILGGSDAYLYFLTDDFYYYLLPAKNLVAHGMSSFDGFTVTNGYHPLWFLCVTGMTFLSAGNDYVIFALVALVSLISSFVTVRLLLRLQLTLFEKSWLSPAVLLVVSMVLVAQSFVGMETVLAIPLFLALLLRVTRLDLGSTITRSQALRLGFFSSLLILARLDTMVAVAMIVLGIFMIAKSSWKNKAAFSLWFALGGVLVPVYFGFNLLHFGYLMPVSAMVKGLKVGHAIRTEAIGFLFTNRDALWGMAFVPVGLATLWFARKRFNIGSQRLAMLVALLYPVVLYTAFFLSSDWYLQRWYLWPLPLCTFITLGAITQMWPMIRNARTLQIMRRGVFALSAIAVLFATYSIITKDIIRFNPDPYSPYVRAKEIIPFVKAHPGRYAMGDAAGTVAYMIGTPVLQTEGLAADHRYYEHIKHEDDLVGVLHEYQIDYLIEFPGGIKRMNGGCYQINAPLVFQAGAHSHTMFGTLCTEPVFSVADTMGPAGAVKEYIFPVSSR